MALGCSTAATACGGGGGGEHCWTLIEFYPGPDHCEKTTFTFRLLILNKKGCLQSIFQGVKLWCNSDLLWTAAPPCPLPFFGLNSICLDSCAFNARALNSCLHFIFNVCSPSLKPKILFGENVCPGRSGCSMCCRRRWRSCRRWWCCPCRPSPGAVAGRPAAASGCSSSWSRHCTLHTRPAQ